MTNDEMAVKLTDVDARCKSNTHRINELAGHIDAVNRLAAAVEVMANEQRHQTADIAGIRGDVKKLGTKVESMEQKPAKRWDGFVDKALWAVAAAIITFFLARMGL